MNWKVIFTLIFMCTLVNSSAQETLSLEKALAIGLENNFQIKISEANIRIAEINNSWARAGRGPVIDLNGTFNTTVTQDNNRASFLNGAFANGSLGATVDLQWTVLSGGRIQISKDQLNLLVTQQELNRSVNINDMFRDVVQAFQNVVLQQERLGFLQESLELSRERLEYEETRRQFGASNSFNLIQFEEAVLSDSINLLAQGDVLQNAQRSLYSLLNILPDEDYEISGALVVFDEELDKTRLMRALEEDNFTLKTLSVVQNLDALNTRLAASATKPTLNINSSLGFAENYFKILQQSENSNIPTDGILSNRFNFSVGASLNWNLYDGGLRKDDFATARIQEEIDQYDILRTTVELGNQIDILIESYNRQKEILRMNDQQIEVVRRNLVMAEDRLRSGRISSIDFRAIQNQYLNASFTKTNTIFNLLMTKSEIDWLIGAYAKS